MQPYKTVIVHHNYFQFTTSAGIVYACYFLPYSEYFKEYKAIAESIYSFNVEKLKDRKTKRTNDDRIGRTIIEILKPFLSGLENVVVYVCDTSDGKELFAKENLISGSENMMMEQ